MAGLPRNELVKAKNPKASTVTPEAEEDWRRGRSTRPALVGTSVTLRFLFRGRYCSLSCRTFGSDALTLHG
jgi:hypothetical protein